MRLTIIAGRRDALRILLPIDCEILKLETKGGIVNSGLRVCYKARAAREWANRSAQMRGHREPTCSLFSYVSIEERIPASNSLRILLAKPLLKVAELADEVGIEAAPGVLTIRPSAHTRAGWAEAALSFEPEGVLDEMSATRFDDKELLWCLRKRTQEATSFLSR
jgi:hypothetical protein